MKILSKKKEFLPLKNIKKMKSMWILYAFMGVFAVLSLVFSIFPMLGSMYYSFFKTNTSTFVGLKNYSKIFQDQYFWNSFKMTLLFTVISVPLNLLLALILAEIINYKGIKRGKLFFKLAIFIPFITPDVVGAVVWKQFFNTEGAMNQLLAMWGIPPVGWLNHSTSAILVLVFVELWKHVGLYTIIFLTNYQLIDTTMYEAAHLDGANAWQTYVAITLPSLKPALTLNGVYALIQFLKTYTVVRIITLGGPNYATNFLSYYAYSKYEKTDYGSATAIASVLFLFIVIITLVGLKMGGRKSEAK